VGGSCPRRSRYRGAANRVREPPATPQNEFFGLAPLAPSETKASTMMEGVHPLSLWIASRTQVGHLPRSELRRQRTVEPELALGSSLSRRAVTSQQQ
jgi:hypothetical protein